MTTNTPIPDLVLRARQGDGAAFDALVTRHAAASLAYARALLRDDRAEEAVQDAFLEAYQALDRLREPAAFPGWLRRIVHKQCDRRTRRQSAVADAEADRVVSTDPEGSLDAAARWSALRRAVEELPEHERIVVALHHLGGVPVAEIAAFLQVSPGSVKTRLSRARARLRASLETPMNAPMTPALHDAVRLFLALHAGDAGTVDAVLDRHPDLIDREEAWSDEEALAGGFPLAHPRTPLMVAASLGDCNLVDRLLARGADPSGRCSCTHGESAVWVATRFGHQDVARRLLVAGADPESTHRRGMDLAALRAWRSSTPATAWAMQADGTLHTGLGAVDLWLRPRRGDVVRVTGAAETGLMVLLTEVSAAVGAAGGRAIWPSWVPHPWHASELEGVARRCGVETWVDVVTPATRALDAPEAVLPAGLDATRLARECGGPLVHIVFEQRGHAIDLQPHLTHLGEAADLTLIVRPWADVTAGVAFDDTWAGQGEIVTSAEVARRGVWPALDPVRTRSTRPDDPLTARARGAASDLDHPVLKALLQPFHAAFGDTGWPGVAWDREALERRVGDALGGGLEA